MTTTPRSNPRPGFVLEVDQKTPPVVFPHGSSFTLETLPQKTSRVLYPSEPFAAAAETTAMIADAFAAPQGSAPLSDLLKANTKLTIVFSDISYPYPAMRKPDIRQQVIEHVLELAASAGCDDVHLIAATGLQRKMTDKEFRHVLGDRICGSFDSDQLYSHNAYDRDALTTLSAKGGESFSLNTRVAESDLVVAVNVCSHPTHSGWHLFTNGLSDYQASYEQNNPTLAKKASSVADTKKSAAYKVAQKQGQLLDKYGPTIFHIEAVVNNNVYGDGPLRVLQKREWEWNLRDKAAFGALRKGLTQLAGLASRKAGNAWRAPYETIALHCGDVAAVHNASVEKLLEQNVVPVEGQSDILTMGLSDFGPHSVDSTQNPLLALAEGLGTVFNNYIGKPLVRKGGVIIMSHPMKASFDPVHHSPHIDFFEEVIKETTDAPTIEETYADRFVNDDWYKHLHQTGFSFHGGHPLQLWYQLGAALTHVAQVIVVGGDTETVRTLGLKPASTLQDALEMAEAVVGKDATLSHVASPHLIAHVS